MTSNLPATFDECILQVRQKLRLADRVENKDPQLFKELVFEAIEEWKATKKRFNILSG